MLPITNTVSVSYLLGGLLPLWAWANVLHSFRNLESGPCKLSNFVNMLGFAKSPVFMFFVHLLIYAICIYIYISWNYICSCEKMINKGWLKWSNYWLRLIKFGVNGVNIGLFCSTPMVALSRNITRKKAFEMLTTGDFISAEQAKTDQSKNKQLHTDPSVSRSRTTILISSPNFFIKSSSMWWLYTCSSLNTNIKLQSL